MIEYQVPRTATAGPPSMAERPSCRAALLYRMADDMREMDFAGETVSAETLAQRGWSQPAIKRLSVSAIPIARRQSVRRLA